MGKSEWEKADKYWKNISHRRRKFLIKTIIAKKEISYQTIMAAGGISSLSQRSFRKLPVEVCDAVVRLSVLKESDDKKRLLKRKKK